MLKLYTNIKFLTEANRRQVFPLLFDVVYTKNEDLLKVYRVVETITQADVVVIPIDYSKMIKHTAALSQLSELATKHSKPLWVYTAGDYGVKVPIKNVYNFRLGGFHTKLSTNTFVIPSFINDPYETYLEQPFKALPKPEKPSIGFVGHAKSGVQKYIKEYVNHVKYIFKRTTGIIKADKQSFYPSSIKRAKYLAILEEGKNVETNFIFRHSYRAGLHSVATQKASSLQFYNNIYHNAYTFCLRGVGNFSVRFYETLAVGRIPVLIDTDCRLPLADKIPWEKHCVIINEKEITTMANVIEAFHNRLTPVAFDALQQSNRLLWQTLLRREAYFTAIQTYFKNAV